MLLTNETFFGHKKNSQKDVHFVQTVEDWSLNEHCWVRCFFFKFSKVGFCAHWNHCCFWYIWNHARIFMSVAIHLWMQFVRLRLPVVATHYLRHLTTCRRTTPHQTHFVKAKKESLLSGKLPRVAINREIFLFSTDVMLLHSEIKSCFEQNETRGEKTRRNRPGQWEHRWWSLTELPQFLAMSAMFKRKNKTKKQKPTGSFKGSTRLRQF